MKSAIVQLDRDELLEMLGVRNLPDEGMPERSIMGVRVYVKPLVRVPGRRRNFNGLRMMAICACGQHLAVGRLHQHQCVETCRACKRLIGAGTSAYCIDCGGDREVGR